ncbi:MAG: chitobiase/beta-hexosaminidase C-terminal domain-containing protein [Saprospiraceae bacterium]|nr:chitobiase/beta-hexosaminidase C-terminal domain-containing protein [Saprospiraceae bacterium]
MKKCFQVLLVLLAGLPAMSQNTFQLAPPYIQFESAYFTKECRVSMVFDHPNTQIHYTTNGQIPTEKDPVYTRPILLKKRENVVKARVFGEGFVPSEVVEASFFKSGLSIENIVTTIPHKSYPGSGPKTLIDGLGGLEAFNRKTWAGFQTDTVILEISLAKPQKAKQVLLHVLENQSAWIYLPQKVELFTAKEGTGIWELVGQKILAPSEKKDKSKCNALSLNIKKPRKTDRMLVKIYPLVRIPDGLSGAGGHAWLFMDEVNLY